MSEPGSESQNNNESQGRPESDWSHSGRGWGHEWRRSNPFRGLFPGLVLIVLGILLFLATRGTLSWDSWWQYFLIGLGGIFLLDGFLHYVHPATRHRGSGKFVPGIVLVLVGLAFVIGFSEWWPLVLVGVGVAILLGMLFRRR